MDSRNPSDIEILKLKRLHARHKMWPILGPLVFIPILIVHSLIDNIALSISLTVFGLAFFVYHGLAISILSKCPRCSSRMTLPKGSCTSCGLRLDVPDRGSMPKNVT